ncbi:MAG: DevR family CRISPR-associated autoregulator [Chloracidobacterium sp.]|uniref:DevR family CRISPR-associated autoregulator n=1 Tax=Chloracidobacterium validum TaxID=2821543 RepID=A0ABX8BBR8_9BACT|nr:DevR family CRISPR-associated autoregulator [Chloracidobacterium validum]QUW04144.1 DevR family CRISPR-associated autoregulator [Chloracidobacterium validum]
MTTHYLYATILTGEAVAANNRGDNIGNTTTLQKVFHQDDLHTSVSAEAIRFAFRYRFQLQGIPVNRSYDGEKLHYQDEKRAGWNPSHPNSVLIDDDLMGFMDAAAAQAEQEAEADQADSELSGAATEATPPKAPRKAKARGVTTKRTSPLAVGRAVSLRPYRGEISFNCVSGVKEKGRLSLYAAEMHTTEYQYSIGLNLNDVVNKKHIADLIDALVDPPPVAGNHSRFAYDFSPQSIVLRVTSAHSSRIQNCFEHDENSRAYTVRGLIRRVRSHDITASELIVGGELAETPEGEVLKSLGVLTFPGVAAAANEARARIANLDPMFAVVANGRSS